MKKLSPSSALALAASALATDPSLADMPCQIAPLYVSRNTSAGIGVTVLGKHLFAIRDATRLFTVNSTHTDSGHWSFAFGELRDDTIRMIEGFGGPGKLRPTENPGAVALTDASWRVIVRSSRYCDLVWPDAFDVWWPVVTLPFFVSSKLRGTALLEAYDRAVAAGKLDLPPFYPHEPGSDAVATVRDLSYDYDVVGYDEPYELEYGSCPTSFQSEEDVVSWWQARRR